MKSTQYLIIRIILHKSLMHLLFMQITKDLMMYFYFIKIIQKDFIKKTAHLDRLFTNYFISPSVQKRVHRVSLFYSSDDKKN